jgi:hypothetical protein
MKEINVIKQMKDFIKTLKRTEVNEYVKASGYENLEDFYSYLYLDIDKGAQELQDLISACDSSLGKDFI